VPTERVANDFQVMVAAKATIRSAGPKVKVRVAVQRDGLSSRSRRHATELLGEERRQLASVQLARAMAEPMSIRRRRARPQRHLARRGSRPPALLPNAGVPRSQIASGSAPSPVPATAFLQESRRFLARSP